MKYILLILGLILLIGCTQTLPPSEINQPLIREYHHFEPKDNQTLPYNYIEAHITNLKCDANIACPADLECWKLPNKTLACVDPKPCEWFCNMENCLVLSSYPPKLLCEN